MSTKMYNTVMTAANLKLDQSQYARRVLAEFKIGRTLGEGAFSKVKLGYHRGTNEKVAIKIISKKRLEANYKKREKEKKEREKRAEKRQQEKLKKEAEMVSQGITPPRKAEDVVAAEAKEAELEEERQKERDLEALEQLPGRLTKSLSREVRLLQVLRHANIIRLYQVVETELEFYIITEFAGGGEIIDHIAKREHLPEDEARQYFREIVSAMDYCHRCGIVHRDLKLENILLSGDKHVRITDFGLGRTFEDGTLCSTFCGTPLYAAPELVSGIKYSGPGADIWAMGVVLYAMVCGRPPFQADTMADLYRAIRHIDFEFPNWVSQDCRDLIGLIFVRDPAKRATMEEIRVHPWVNKGYDEPPLRVLPTQPVKQYNSRDSQVDGVKSISYDSDALYYSFHDFTPRDPLKTSTSGNLDDQAVPTPHPSLAEPPSLPSAFSDGVLPLGPLLDPSSLPHAPHPAKASRKTNREKIRESDALPPSRRISTPLSHMPQLLASQPPRPPPPLLQPGTQQGNSLPGRPLSPATSFDNSYNAADMAAAAAAVALQSPARRRVSMATIQGDLHERPVRRPTDVGMIPSGERFTKRNSEGGADGSGGLRSVRGMWQLAATTAKFTPEELMAEVVRVLTMLNISHTVKSDYLVRCVHNSSSERVEVEVEVVKVWLLNMQGLRIHRTGGSAWLYKQIYGAVVAALHLE